MERGADDSQTPNDQPTTPVPAQRPPALERPGPPQRPARQGQRGAHHRFGVEQARNPEFTLVFRGYEREAVDRYVAQVIELITELEATQTREGTVQRALEEVGEQTSSILQRAHETAEEITARSRAQAEGRLAGAERDADQMVAEAEAETQRVRTDARGLWQQRSRMIEELRRLSDEVLTLADDALERLDSPGEDEPTTVETEPTASEGEPARPSTIAAPARAPVGASSDAPEATSDEPAVRGTSPTPLGDGAGEPPRRRLDPIDDRVDVAPEEADAEADDQPTMRRVGPEGRQG